MKQILKVLVGSHAHGLSNPNSDWDYRGVYLAPTREFFKIGSKIKNTHWIEGKTDDTTWELGHFLHLAIKSNPTILETFLAPVEDQSEEGEELRDLFPHVWNSKDAMNAFIGYGHNQRKKFLDGKEGRPDKYAAAHLRVLYNAWELLTTGKFTVSLIGTPVFDQVKKFKEADYSIGEVMEATHEWEQKVKEAFAQNPNKESNIEAINKFLLKIRKANW